MGVMGNADHVFLVDVEGSFELAASRGEAVQDKVLADTVDPLSSWGNAAGNEITTGTFTGSERSMNTIN
jgi:NAD/NADP transhydrogenase alpha subunit